MENIEKVAPLIFSLSIHNSTHVQTSEIVNLITNIEIGLFYFYMPLFSYFDNMVKANSRSPPVSI